MTRERKSNRLTSPFQQSEQSVRKAVSHVIVNPRQRKQIKKKKTKQNTKKKKKKKQGFLTRVAMKRIYDFVPQYRHVPF